MNDSSLDFDGVEFSCFAERSGVNVISKAAGSFFAICNGNGFRSMQANVTGSVRIMHKSATHPAAYRTVATARGSSASTSEYASRNSSESSHNECTSIQPSLGPKQK